MLITSACFTILLKPKPLCRYLSRLLSFPEPVLLDGFYKLVCQLACILPDDDALAHYGLVAVVFRQLTGEIGFFQYLQRFGIGGNGLAVLKRLVEEMHRIRLGSYRSYAVGAAGNIHRIVQHGGGGEVAFKYRNLHIVL